MQNKKSFTKMTQKEKVDALYKQHEKKKARDWLKTQVSEKIEKRKRDVTKAKWTSRARVPE